MEKLVDIILTILPYAGTAGLTLVARYVFVGKQIIKADRAKSQAEEIGDVAQMNNTFREQLHQSNIALIKLQRRYVRTTEDDTKKSVMLMKYNELLDHHFKYCNFTDEDLVRHHRICSEYYHNEFDADEPQPQDR